MQLQTNTKRCLTQEHLEIQQNALSGIQKLIPKQHISKVVKGLCPLRVRGCALAVLDIMFGDLQEEDCQLGARAICFRSNKSFAMRLGVDESTVQRALNKLQDWGVLTFKDSPNHKRYYNKKSGEKFGIDLTPAWNNFEALKTEYAELQAAAALHGQLKRAVKTSRKTQLHTVLKLLEEARAAKNVEIVRLLEQLKSQIEKINNAAMDYVQRLDALEIIKGKLCEIAASLEPENALVPAQMRSSTRANAVHQYNTSLIPLNKFCSLAFEDEQNFKQCFNADFDSVETDTSDFPTCQERVIQFDRSVTSGKSEKLIKAYTGGFEDGPGFSSIDLALARQALPEVITAYGFDWNDWEDVRGAVFALKRGLGVSDHALQEGLDNWRPEAVALCLAVVLEKVLRGHEVKNPGGYVRWMLRRSGNLERVLMSKLLELMKPETACH